MPGAKEAARSRVTTWLTSGHCSPGSEPRSVWWALGPRWPDSDLSLQGLSTSAIRCHPSQDSPRPSESSSTRPGSYQSCQHYTILSSAPADHAGPVRTAHLRLGRSGRRGAGSQRRAHCIPVQDGLMVRVPTTVMGTLVTPSTASPWRRGGWPSTS